MKYNEKIQKKGFYFVLPTLIIYGIFLIYPMLSAFHYSFYKWNMISESKYVGLKHYIRMFGDRRFWNSYLTTFHFTFISIFIIIILSFLLALLFQEKIMLKNFFQSSIFVPVILTMVAIAVVWQFMFQSTGVLSNIFLDIFGINIKWLTSKSVAPYSMILVNVWKITGYYMIIFIFFNLIYQKFPNSDRLFLFFYSYIIYFCNILALFINNRTYYFTVLRIISYITTYILLMYILSCICCLKYIC